MDRKTAERLIKINQTHSEKLASLALAAHEATTDERRSELYQETKDVNAFYDALRVEALGDEEEGAGG